jgi:hypothetical protein
VRFSDQENIGDSFMATVRPTRLADNGSRTATRFVSAERSRRSDSHLDGHLALHGHAVPRAPLHLWLPAAGGSNCGIIGPHASADVNGVSYWMSQGCVLHVFDGTVKKIALHGAGLRL